MPTLTPQQQAEKKRRQGDAIEWTLLALAGLSAVDAQAITLARSVWTRLATDASRDLLDAGTSASRYTFDADAVRYVAPNGRTIVPQAVKQQVATFAERAADEARTMTRIMVDGETTVAEWQTDMAGFVRSVHVAGYTIGRGGMSAIGEADAIVSIVRFQLERLQDFADGVADLTVSDEAAVNRASLYAASVNGTYEAGHNDAWGSLVQQGVAIEMQNILQPGAEHCRTSASAHGCVDETERQWVPFGTMSLPGSRTCGPHCLCRLNYRRRDAAQS